MNLEKTKLKIDVKPTVASPLENGYRNKAIVAFNQKYEMELDNFITVVDAKKCRMYTKNFGEFYNNQVEHASLIDLSRSQDLTEFQLKECLIS